MSDKKKKYTSRIRDNSLQQKTEKETEKTGLLIGRNPVMEALKSGRKIDRLLILKDAEGSAKKIIGMAREKDIIINYADRGTLDRVSGWTSHQGVIAYASDFEYCQVEDILEMAEEEENLPLSSYWTALKILTIWERLSGRQMLREPMASSYRAGERPW